MKTKKIQALFLLSCIICCLASCKKKEYGSITISMKDAPAAYQEVNIDLESIEVYIENPRSGFWHKLNINKGIYDLLLLQDTPVLLATQSKIPLGKISKIKITLGNRNTVKENNIYYPLQILHKLDEKYMHTISTNYTIAPNSISDIIIDFDAEKSVIKTPEHNFLLSPVIITGTESPVLNVYESLF
jgi:hypothetical protein